MDQYPGLEMPQTSPYPQGEKISVIVDKDKFVHTRNALTNAFVGLSGAIDTAVKAYVAHTNAVLEEGSTLDVSYLMQPLTNINNVAQIAQQVLQNGHGAMPIPGNVWPNGQVPQGFNADGSKKKRQYKPRDPNAPKRPLTAYFRYLQEMRPKIAAEVQARGPPADGNKAGDISKIATERWNSLPANEQAPYRAAYKREMVNYDEAVKQYKAQGGEVGDGEEDAAAEDDDEVPSPPGPVTVKAGADEEEDDDEDSSDSEDSSEEDSDEEPAKPAPPPKKSTSPEVAKKTPKAKKATAKAGADPVAPTPQTFSSLNGFAPPAAEMVAPSSSPTRKRKADATPAEGEKKKKGRKSNAEKLTAEAAATPSSQLVPESTEKPKKEKKEKKKRKSEAAAA